MTFRALRLTGLGILLCGAACIYTLSLRDPTPDISRPEQRDGPPRVPSPDVKTASTTPEAAGKGAFNYVAAWRGYKKGKMGFGTGTVELIHPKWAVTASHVATKKIRDPSSVNAVLLFPNPGKNNPRVVKVKKAYGGFTGDFALLELQHPVMHIRPVSLLANPITKQDGVITFTMAGKSGGLHVHHNRKGKSKDGEGFYHSKDANGGRPGKAGDSGGAWVITRDKGQSHVLFAVIHGGGKGPQIAPNRKRIDAIMGKSGAVADWVPKKEVARFMRSGKNKQK